MTSEPLKLRPLTGLGRGFVVAMRATLTGLDTASPHEWMIVSRWGTHGEFLSMAWTSEPADAGDAPIKLTPGQTALALRHHEPAARIWTTFLLMPTLPDGVTVAGSFVPAEGYVRLYGNTADLGLRSRGHCLEPGVRPAWDLRAR